MTWNADVAAKILDKRNNVFFIQPVIKYTHRYQIRKNDRKRHLALAKERTNGAVTAYINRLSINGELFKEGAIQGIHVAEYYPMGHKGKTGDVGISSSVARLETLDPSRNEVLRLHIDGPEAFQRLIDWYSDDLRSNRATEEAIDPQARIKQITSEAESRPNSDNDAPSYQLDPEKRLLTEKYAVKLASEHYERQGFSIEERGKPFDLLCTKPSLTVHVEVKGTIGKGATVTLTRNEVRDARTPDWRSDLFIVSNITLIPTAETWLATGGNVDIFEAWQPEEEDLMPIEYEYRVPKRP